ncbi:MAG: RNA-binding protein [Ruminococcaceae bacterium]|nr:RNA-binding protein [Oscillospiraceae bacterium]
MLDAHPGEFVYATAGRDAGKCFIVLAVENEYLFIADGKGRKVSTPKKKKIKHLKLTGKVDNFIENRLSSLNKVTNKEVRYAISNFLGNRINEENVL